MPPLSIALEATEASDRFGWCPIRPKYPVAIGRFDMATSSIACRPNDPSNLPPGSLEPVHAGNAIAQSLERNWAFAVDHRDHHPRELRTIAWLVEPLGIKFLSRWWLVGRPCKRRLFGLSTVVNRVRNVFLLEPIRRFLGITV